MANLNFQCGSVRLWDGSGTFYPYIGLRIRILLLSSVAFVMFFFQVFFSGYRTLPVLTEGTFTSIFKNILYHGIPQFICLLMDPDPRGPKTFGYPTHPDPASEQCNASLNFNSIPTVLVLGGEPSSTKNGLIIIPNPSKLNIQGLRIVSLMAYFQVLLCFFR